MKTRPDNLGGPRGTRWVRGDIADANTSQLRSVSSGWTLGEVSLRFRPRRDPLRRNEDQPLLFPSVDRIFLSFFSPSFLYHLVSLFLYSYPCGSRDEYKALETWTEKIAPWWSNRHSQCSKQADVKLYDVDADSRLLLERDAKYENRVGKCVWRA